MCTMNQRMRQKLCFYQPGSTSGASCHWQSCRDAHWPPQTGTPGRRTAPRSPCVACVHLQRYPHQSSSSPASNVWCDSCLACNVSVSAKCLPLRTQLLQLHCLIAMNSLGAWLRTSHAQAGYKPWPYCSPIADACT